MGLVPGACPLSLNTSQHCALPCNWAPAYAKRWKSLANFMQEVAITFKTRDMQVTNQSAVGQWQRIATEQ